jgi:tetratricopeptide (TPR) repeat protein
MPSAASSPAASGVDVNAGLQTAANDMYGNRYSAADAEYQRLLHVAPRGASVHAQYALFLNYRLDFTDALQQARDAVALDRGCGECAAILTRVEDWSGDIGAALKTARGALRLVPRDPLVLLFAAEATADSGDRATAQQEIDAAAAIIKLHPTAYLRSEVQREQANLDGDAGDVQLQIGALRSALALQPVWLYRTSELVSVEVQAGEDSAARAALDAVAGAVPDDLETVETLTGDAINAGDGAVALRMGQHAVNLAPGDPAVLDSAAELEVAVQRNVVAAVADLEQSLGVDPGDAQAAAYLVALARYVQHDPSLGVIELHDAWLRSAVPGTRFHGPLIVDPDAPWLASAQRALADVNAARAEAGEYAVTLDPRLSASAESHSFYWLFNILSPGIAGLGVHQETPGLLGFSGRWPWDRAPAFGYFNAGIAEDITHRSDPDDAVADWVNSVFHRFAILRPDLVAIGYGQAQLGPQLIDDMEFGFSTATPAQPVLFPASNQRAVPTTFFDNELPDPVPAGAPRTTGYPVTVTFTYADRVSLQSFTLAPSGGPAVPAYVLSPSQETQNSASLLPAAPLRADTTYVAHIIAQVGGTRYDRSWTFTTS